MWELLVVTRTMIIFALSQVLPPKIFFLIKWSHFIKRRQQNKLQTSDFISVVETINNDNGHKLSNCSISAKRQKSDAYSDKTHFTSTKIRDACVTSVNYWAWPHLKITNGWRFHIFILLFSLFIFFLCLSTSKCQTLWLPFYCLQ